MSIPSLKLVPISKASDPSKAFICPTADRRLFSFYSRSQLQSEIPAYNIPHTICHELSHLKGYMGKMRPILSVTWPAPVQKAGHFATAVISLAGFTREMLWQKRIMTVL